MLSDGDDLLPIEIKAKLSPGREDIEALLRAQRLLGFRKAAVVCLGKARYPMADGIECIGIEAWADTGFAPFWARDQDEGHAETEGKVHPWRLCSYGKHAVRAHPLHIRPSENHPDGKTTRHYHCAFNRNRKDVLNPFEMQIMAEDHFSTLDGPPKTEGPDRDRVSFQS